MGNAMRGILAPGNDHLEPDDGLTEAPGEEEEENDEDLASLPELISSEEEDDTDLIDGMAVTHTNMVVIDETSLTPPGSLVNGALGRVVGISLRREVNARGQSHQHLLLHR